MKLQLPNPEQFSIRKVEINNESCFLINPKPDFREYTEELMNYRSVILDSQLNIISAGLPKAFNDGERPDLRKLPDDINQINWLEKMDGSCILVSRNGIIRTRGSHTVDHHDTGPEVRRLIEDYKINSIFDQCSGNYTLVFEHISPNNKIILNYENPDLIFIGKISHDTYKLDSQWALNRFAEIYNLKRPYIYKFASYEEAINNIKNWKSDEGVVAYYDNDQKMIKIKALHYLKLHKLKSSYGSLNNLIEHYLIYLNSSHMGTFFNYIATNADFEIAQFCSKDIERIEKVNCKLEIILDEIKKFCNYNWFSQKIFAIAAQKEYNGIQLSLAYEIKASKEQKISDKTRKKWLEKELCGLCSEPVGT